MHLKILIGVLILGLATASPKAAPIPKPKPIAKATPQLFQGYPGAQSNYFTGAPSYFGQEFNSQPILGQDAAGYSYSSGFAPTGYQSPIGSFSTQRAYPQASAGNYQPTAAAGSYYQPSQISGANYYQSFQAPASNYYQTPQTAAGNYYQSSQLIPVPVGYPSGYSATGTQPVEYPSGSSAQNLQPPNYYGPARLWPKALISPAGSPSPVPENLARAYYAVSTPSPLSFTTPTNQHPLSTQSPFPSSPQKLTPVPVKVDSRNYFQNIPFSGSTPSPHLSNFQQQSAPAQYDQRYLQPEAYSFSTTAPRPQTAPHYPVNYQSTPAPFQVNQQYNPSASAPTPPAQSNYQSAPASPVQPTYQQQSTPSPYSIQYQQPTSAPYQGYQLPGVSARSPFDYQQQPSSSPYVSQYQQQSMSPFDPYYHPTAYPYQQRIPVPVAYPQSQISYQPTPPTPVAPTQSTPTAYFPSPNVPVTSKPITILPTSPTPVKEVSITENTFIPIPTAPGPDQKTNAKIIKSEYSGTILPQYNHIPLDSTSYKYTTPTPFLAESAGKSSYGLSYAPGKSYSTYSPSTPVSHVNFNGLGNSYSY